MLRYRLQALLSLLFLLGLIFPQHSLQAESLGQSLVFDTANSSGISILSWGYDAEQAFAPSKKVVKLYVTAYNSEPQQTDSTPTITAFGTQTRDGIIATNYLPAGTRVRFPDLYGNKVFVVEDRMNIRYHKRADIWMEDKAAAQEFGIRYLRMEIL